MKKEYSSSRRDFVKKAAYVAPVILTLQAAPAYAKAGSIKGNPEPKPIVIKPPRIKPPKKNG